MMHIILDLDHTLIASVTKQENTSLVAPDHSMGDYDYDVYERPGLQNFLDRLCDKFKVSVWTAASKNYASFILENCVFRNDRKIENIFTAYHCDISGQMYEGNNKNIRLLTDVFGLEGYENAVLIDDTKEWGVDQLDRFILIDRFFPPEDNSDTLSYYSDCSIENAPVDSVTCGEDTVLDSIYTQLLEKCDGEKNIVKNDNDDEKIRI